MLITQDDVIKLKDSINERRISLTEIADLSGINYNTCTQFLSCKTNGINTDVYYSIKNSVDKLIEKRNILTTPIAATVQVEGKPSYRRGEIYFVENENSSGSEIKGNRPAILVGNDIELKTSPVLKVVYLTTKIKPYMPTHVVIKETKYESIATCEQIYTVSVHRIKNYIAICSDEEITELDQALKFSFGLQDDEVCSTTIHNEICDSEWVEKRIEFERVKTEASIYKRFYEDLVLSRKSHG